jgi:PIN domain nuclease of toxin-antitoxin system
MKFLLDTHIWLWSLLKTHRLRRSISEVLENGINELFISPITIWETIDTISDLEIKICRKSVDSMELLFECS